MSVKYHYVVKKDQSRGSRIHKRYDTLDAAVVDVLNFDKVHVPPTYWWVLTTERQMANDAVVEDIT